MENIKVIMSKLSRYTDYSFMVATMIWLTITEYLCHKWPPICAVCRNHNPVLSSCMTYQRVCNKSNTTGAIMWSRNCLPFRSTWVQPRFLVGFVLPDL